MTAKILNALHEVMTKVGYVQKAKENKFHGYKYAGEANLLAVLRPAMVEAGLLLIPSVTEAKGPDEFGNTTVRIEYTLAHKDGDVWPEKVCAMGCGNDKNTKGGIGDKGIFKAITGANKYALFKLFQIETGDDPETEESEPAPPPAKAPSAPRQSGPTMPPNTPPAVAEFFARASYEIACDDLLTFSTKLSKAIAAAPTFDALNKLEEDNKSDLAALNHHHADVWKQVIANLTYARKQHEPKAA